MLTKTDIDNYFISYRQEHLFLLMLAAVAIVTAAIFYFANKKNFYKGVIFLAGFIVVLRIASYYLPIPLNLRQFDLFNPNIYGSNSILRSLGDLLINAIVFLWLILFVRHYIQEENITIKK